MNEALRGNQGSGLGFPLLQPLPGVPGQLCTPAGRETEDHASVSSDGMGKDGIV